MRWDRAALGLAAAVFGVYVVDAVAGKLAQLGVIDRLWQLSAAVELLLTLALAGLLMSAALVRERRLALSQLSDREEETETTEGQRRPEGGER